MSVKTSKMKFFAIILKGAAIILSIVVIQCATPCCNAAQIPTKETEFKGAFSLSSTKINFVPFINVILGGIDFTARTDDASHSYCSSSHLFASV